MIQKILEGGIMLACWDRESIPVLSLMHLKGAVAAYERRHAKAKSEAEAEEKPDAPKHSKS
jgi:hypothetical protein